MAKSLVANTDVLMSIKKEHIGNIAQDLKNHEYRKYLLPASVERIWFYTTSPSQELRYVARISQGKQPGEVPEDGGIGNDDFNAGRKESKYGYEISMLWVLRQPLTLEEDNLQAVETDVQHWYDDLPTWLTNSWKSRKGAVTGSLSLQLSYLAVTITLARLKLRKRRKSSQYRAQETAEPLKQCRCAAEQVVHFVIELEIADVDTFWLPYSAYHLVMSVTVLLRCAVDIKDVSTSRQCIDSCEAMFTKLRSLNEEPGFDIGNICLAQCTGSVDRVKKKLETRSFDEHADTGDSFEGWEIGSIFALPELGSDGSLFDSGAFEEDLGSWRQ